MLGDPEHETFLREELARVLARVGPRRFVRGALVTPDERCFPDRYAHDARGVLVVARRVLAHLGERDLPVEVRDEREKSARLLARHALAVEVATESGIVLTLTQLGPAETLPSLVAHRVVHAWRTARGLDRPLETAFRGSPEPDEPELEPLRDDLTLFATGLGVMAVTGAERFAAAGRIVGRDTETEWAHERDGTLDGPEAAYLLAVQLVVRSTPDTEVARLRERLGPNAQADLDRAMEELSPRADGLRQELGVTAKLLAEAEGAIDVAPLEKDPRCRVIAKRGAPVSTSTRGRPVFRVAESLAGGYGCAGLIVGFLVALPATSALGAGSLVFVLASALLGALLGAQRTYDVCSDPQCTGKLPPDASSCPACQRPIRGRIANARERLDAEERVEREDREARAAARVRLEEPEADEDTERDARTQSRTK